MASNEGAFRPLDALRATLDGSNPLSSTERLVILALVRRADSVSGEAWPSLATIATDTGLSRRAIAAALARIEADPYAPVRLSRRRRSKGATQEPDSTLYRLSLPSAPRSPGSEAGAPPSEAGALQVVNEVHQGSAPRAPYLPSELHSGTAQVTLPGVAGAPTGGDAPVKGNKGQRKARAEPEATPGFAVARDCYFAAYESARGAKPPFGAREGKAVKSLLEKLGGDPERACKCIVNAFSDAFWRDRVTINTIAADPGKFDGTRAAPAARSYGPPKQPGGFVDTSIDIDKFMGDTN